MYFLDLKGLVSHLRQNRTTQAENLSYLIGFVWLRAGDGFLERALGEEVKEPMQSLGLAAVALFVTVAVTLIVVGILKGFYQRNGGDQGIDFLSRFLALSWVIGLRCGIVGYPLFAFLKFGLQGDMGKSGWLLGGALALITALFAYYIVAMRQSFREIRSAELAAPL